MNSTSFSGTAASPRATKARPNYPALLTATLTLSTALSCAAPLVQETRAETTGIPTTSPTPTTIVVSAPTISPPAGETAPVKAHRERDRLPVFPVDKAPLALSVCAGGCPPAYQQGASSKDVKQITARIAYCVDQANPPINAEGTLVVHVEINGRGLANLLTFRDVLTSGNVPQELLQCIHRLVTTARFHSENNYTRQHDVEFEFPR